MSETKQPIGTTVVKEAWIPEVIAEDGKKLHPVRRRIPADGDKPEKVLKILPYARKDRRLYRAREKSGLFILYKLDPSTPGTDEGWVYGTVTPDGARVLSAGHIASCVECHRKAPYDRLFGKPPLG